MEKDRIDWIDSFKGIAMIGVVLMHAGGSNLPGFIGKICKSGHFGVQIFFMITGYLTWASLDKNYSNYGAYIKRKLLRLLPAYYLAFFISIVLFGITSLPDLLVHIFGLWGLFPQFHNNYIAEWYLGAILIFIAVAPILWRIINSKEKAFIFCIISIFESIIANNVLKRIVVLFNVGDNYSVRTYAGNTSIWIQLPSIAIGVFLYYFLKGFQDRQFDKIIQKKLWSYSLLFIALVLILGEIFEKNKLMGFNPYVRITCCFFILAISQMITPCPLIVNSLFSVVGKHSYIIYLFHYLILREFSLIIADSSSLVFVFKVIIAITVPCLLASLISKGKEYYDQRKNS